LALINFVENDEICIQIDGDVKVNFNVVQNNLGIKPVFEHGGQAWVSQKIQLMNCGEIPPTEKALKQVGFAHLLWELGYLSDSKLIVLYKAFCGDVETSVELSDHVQGELALVAEDLGDPARSANIRHQIFIPQALLHHAKADSLHGVGRLNRQGFRRGAN